MPEAVAKGSCPATGLKQVFEGFRAVLAGFSRVSLCSSGNLALARQLHIPKTAGTSIKSWAALAGPGHILRFGVLWFSMLIQSNYVKIPGIGKHKQDLRTTMFVCWCPSSFFSCTSRPIRAILIQPATFAGYRVRGDIEQNLAGDGPYWFGFPAIPASCLLATAGVTSSHILNL